MNFFEMLILSRKITFEEGSATLYGQNILIFPYRPLMEYIAHISSDTELTKGIYFTAKESILENKAGIVKAYVVSDGQNWICNTINLLGQGKIKYDNPNTGPTGAVLLENSALAKDLKGKTTYAVDHVLRGIVAGIVSAVLDKDTDIIETDCYATGSNACKFFIDSKENLNNKFPVLSKQQIMED